MNEQRFDRLFKDNLSNYSELPSANALNKLNQQLDQRKRRAWMNFAKLVAALLLIAISVVIVQNWADPLNKEVAQIDDKQPADEYSTKVELPISTNSTLANSSNQPPGISSAEVTLNIKQDSSGTAIKNIPETQFNTEQSGQTVLLRPDKVTAASSNQVESEIVSEPGEVLVLEDNVPARPKVTITYKKSPEPPEPMLAFQAQPKKKSRVLKKLWVKAQTINFNEISLASIRGSKDEILAIDKKSKVNTPKSN